MSGIPNDDESLELVERMLLLFHLPEFFQKEETKKYSDALRFLEEADPNQPDCLALLETQPQLERQLFLLLVGHHLEHIMAQDIPLVWEKGWQVQLLQMHLKQIQKVIILTL